MDPQNVCITSEQLAADLSASFLVMIDQLILLSWIWAVVFIVIGWMLAPVLSFVAAVVLRRIRLVANRFRRRPAV